MLGKTPWLMIAVGVLIIVLLVLAIFLKKKKKVETDYYTLFIIGVIWIPVGIAIGNYVLAVIGLVGLTIGLINRKKWKKPVSWNKQSKKQRMFRTIAVVGFSLLLAIGLVIFYLFNKGLI